ncbi:MAG TPA: hypothetical protein VK919_00395 [Solirubrobacterales bacterium]|nr:hypothetical protein [Solirubrobacterales bacterium]
MHGPRRTPTEAVNTVAHRHAQLVERGADHESALRLVIDQFGLRPEAARWAVSTGRSRHQEVANGRSGDDEATLGRRGRTGPGENRTGRDDTDRTRVRAVAELRRTLLERHPGLALHGADVARLAVATGERLGLDPVELVELARAAELHDIGK